MDLRIGLLKAGLLPNRFVMEVARHILKEYPANTTKPGGQELRQLAKEAINSHVLDEMKSYAYKGAAFAGRMERLFEKAGDDLGSLYALATFKAIKEVRHNNLQDPLMLHAFDPIQRKALFTKIIEKIPPGPKDKAEAEALELEHDPIKIEAYKLHQELVSHFVENIIHRFPDEPWDNQTKAAAFGVIKAREDIKHAMEVAVFDEELENLNTRDLGRRKGISQIVAFLVQDRSGDPAKENALRDRISNALLDHRMYYNLTQDIKYAFLLTTGTPPTKRELGQVDAWRKQQADLREKLVTEEKRAATAFRGAQSTGDTNAQDAARADFNAALEAQRRLASRGIFFARLTTPKTATPPPSSASISSATPSDALTIEAEGIGGARGQGTLSSNRANDLLNQAIARSNEANQTLQEAAQALNTKLNSAAQISFTESSSTHQAQQAELVNTAADSNLQLRSQLAQFAADAKSLGDALTAQATRNRRASNRQSLLEAAERLANQLNSFKDEFSSSASTPSLTPSSSTDSTNTPINPNDLGAAFQRLQNALTGLTTMAEMSEAQINDVSLLNQGEVVTAQLTHTLQLLANPPVDQNNVAQLRALWEQQGPIVSADPRNLGRT